ncbi:MAG: hypothetical protein ACTSRP_12755 [Candidatus Helarchaeota archaeon]
MKNRELILLLILGMTITTMLTPKVYSLVIVSEDFEFIGIKCYTIHGVSPNSIIHKIQLTCNTSVELYILGRALNITEVNTKPTEYDFLYTGSDISETFELSAIDVSILIYSENSVSGHITWDYGFGYPTEWSMVLIGIILIVSLGVGFFILYKVNRWRKLKE